MARSRKTLTQVTSAARRVVAPKLKSPASERGLTHSPYFHGPLYERMSEDLYLGGILHVGDIDSKRMMVHVHRGKGAKDRCIPLPEATLKLLREF